MTCWRCKTGSGSWHKRIGYWPIGMQALLISRVVQSRLHLHLPRRHTAQQNTAAISRIIWGYRTSRTSTNRQLDDETIRLFRQLCSKMCALAKKATEMEPRKKDWWRLRALLAGHNRSFGELADADAIVQGAAHDPDNALYDYLRAFNCIDGAYADLEDRDESVLVDGKLLMQAWSHWMAAVDKPLLATGIDRAGAAADFIRKRQAPITTKLGLVRPEVYHDLQLGLIQAIRAECAISMELHISQVY